MAVGAEKAPGGMPGPFYITMTVANLAAGGTRELGEWSWRDPDFDAVVQYGLLVEGNLTDLDLEFYTNGESITDNDFVPAETVLFTSAPTDANATTLGAVVKAGGPSWKPKVKNTGTGSSGAITIVWKCRAIPKKGARR